MTPKLSCNLCGKTNQVLCEKCKYIWHKGPDEYYTDETAVYYRCSGCGKVLCEKCVKRLKITTKERHFLSTEKNVTCPTCGARMIQIAGK